MFDYVDETAINNDQGKRAQKLFAAVVLAEHIQSTVEAQGVQDPSSSSGTTGAMHARHVDEPDVKPEAGDSEGENVHEGYAHAEDGADHGDTIRCSVVDGDNGGDQYGHQEDGGVFG